MNTSLYDFVTRTFAAVEAKDLDMMMSLFADDAVLIDPHFSIPRMHGKAAITEGLRGAIVRNAILRLHNRQLFRVGEWSTRGSRDRDAPRHKTGDEAKFPASVHLRSIGRAHHEDLRVKRPPSSALEFALEYGNALLIY